MLLFKMTIFSLFVWFSVADAGYIFKPCKCTADCAPHCSLVAALLAWQTSYLQSFIFQKIGYDKAAAVAKKAHKEGTTLKVNDNLKIPNLVHQDNYEKVLSFYYTKGWLWKFSIFVLINLYSSYLVLDRANNLFDYTTSTIIQLERSAVRQFERTLFYQALIWLH